MIRVGGGRRTFGSDSRDVFVELGFHGGIDVEVFLGVGLG
jgi:hypothetical protein